MKVIGEYNKISNELKKEIPKLKPGQTVTFQMLNGVVNPEPDQTERQKTPMLYGKTQIPTNDRIFDPYLNGGEGGYVDIGVIETYGKDSFGNLEVATRLLVPGLGHYQFGGKFSLTGGKIEDEELFEFLWISNYNAKNQHRDKSKKSYYQPVNILEDSRENIKTTSTLRDALNYAANLEVGEAKQIAASLNWPTYAEDTVLVAKINDFATKFPEQFLNAANSPKTKTKAVVKKALDAGIITFDGIAKTIHLGSELLATLTIRDSDNFLNSFADWINTSRNGQEVFDNIKNQVEAKKEENSFIDKKTKKKAEVSV